VTGFGYTRAIGELRKLGIKKISRQTVRNILKEEGIQPGPDRTFDSWVNFIERHKEILRFRSLVTVHTPVGSERLHPGKPLSSCKIIQTLPDAPTGG
jgi:hypothetical protein